MTTALGEKMYLSGLTISRFRSCDSVNVLFQPDLTILVGENNGGKSNIIDAIRLLTMPLSGRRERYPEDDDLHRGATVQNFQIDGTYSSLSDTLKGLLISAVPDPTQDKALFGVRFEPRSSTYPRGKTTVWAGTFDNNEPEAGSTDLIRHVYLPPLRDAQQALGSGSGSRVMALFRQFLPKEQETEFMESVRRNSARPGLLETVNREIDTALGVLTSGVRQQKAKLDFGAETLLDVARDLRFKLADVGLAPEDIRASGLGYSNLLYMATVVVELAKAKDADLTLFLVEEPEAHLHPQLQMLVLEFLLDAAKKSIQQEVAPGQPEGRIQVIVTTHSPNLTAWVSPKHIVVIRSKVQAESGSTSATVSVPIAKLNLPLKTLNKINRYLDVTRSALLFGSRAILVEGIAEALLLPVIAQRLVLQNDPNGWLRFKGTVIVPIDGVDFCPYVNILLRAHNGVRIANRVIVVTDADPAVRGDRKANLEGLATRLGASSALDVVVNQCTLEHEIFAAGNEAFLKKVFLKLHRGSRADWVQQIENIPVVGRADAFLSLLASKKTRKGDLAQEMAAQIDAGESFVTPPYLEDAIQKAVAP